LLSIAQKLALLPYCTIERFVTMTS